MDANGFQQRQLANLAGISPTTLNNWLRSYSYPEPELSGRKKTISHDRTGSFAECLPDRQGIPESMRYILKTVSRKTSFRLRFQIAGIRRIL